MEPSWHAIATRSAAAAIFSRASRSEACDSCTSSTAITDCASRDLAEFLRIRLKKLRPFPLLGADCRPLFAGSLSSSATETVRGTSGTNFSDFSDCDEDSGESSSEA